MCPTALPAFQLTGAHPRSHDADNIDLGLGLVFLDSANDLLFGVSRILHIKIPIVLD